MSIVVDALADRLAAPVRARFQAAILGAGMLAAALAPVPASGAGVTAERALLGASSTQSVTRVVAEERTESSPPAAAEAALLGRGSGGIRFTLSAAPPPQSGDGGSALLNRARPAEADAAAPAANASAGR